MQQPNSSQETIHENGGLVKLGHQTFSNGLTFTDLCLLFPSSERLSLTTGKNRSLNIDVETSYISVDYSDDGGKLATCDLTFGLADNHQKVIVVSSLAENAILQVTCTLIAPRISSPSSFIFYKTGQSAVLRWDSVLQSWVIIGSGCSIITKDDVDEPDWVEKFSVW